MLRKLDVSFFKPLKSTWGKSCENFRLSHPVTKHEFAEVFREAWVSCVKMSTIVNGFRESGIYPLNPSALTTAKLNPSLPFSASEKPFSVSKKQSEMLALMKPETVVLLIND